MQIPVSIIVPAFMNDESLIHTIESVLNNQYKFELVVVDSGQNAKISKLLGSYSEFTQFRYLFCDLNGVYNAINLGLEHIQNDYFFVLGAGDTLISEKVSILSNIDFAKVSCVHLFDTLMLSSDKQPIIKRRNKQSFSTPAVMHAGIIGYKYNMGGVLRRFSPDYRISSDFDWVCQCLSDGLTFNYHKDYCVAVAEYGLSGRLKNLFRKKFEHFSINSKYEKSWNRRFRFQLFLLKTTLTSFLGFIIRTR